MDLPDPQRQPHVAAVLGAALRPGGEPSHAYLLHGPAGSGKADVARAVAAALLSEDAADVAGVRARVRAGTHPDLTWVRPTGAAEMRVVDVDGPVVAAVHRRPLEARRRVFVVERADRMNDTAANRLLKTLEEPPDYVHLLLLTDRPGGLLPTIRSRCLEVRLHGATPEALADELVASAGLAPEEARACARLALGDRRGAQALATPDGAAVRRAAEALARTGLGTAPVGAAQPWRDLVGAARARGAAAAADVRAQAAERAAPFGERDGRRIVREGEEEARRAERRARTEALDVALRLAGLWLRDVAACVVGAQALVHHADRRAVLGDDAGAHADVGRLLRGVDEVEATRLAVRLAAAEEPQLDALVVRLRGVLVGAG